MRIGEITKDNYTDYIKMFGGKNPQSLEEMWGKDKKTTGTEKSIPNKDTNTFGVSGMDITGNPYAEPGMDITGMTQADFKIVKVSDDIRNKLTDLALNEFISGNGMSDGEERSALQRSYIASVPASERINVGWTLNQIYLDEAQRLHDYVKSKVPGWQAGKPFGRSILDDYVSGGLDIKA